MPGSIRKVKSSPRSRGREPAARRASSSRVSVSGRREGSTPAALKDVCRALAALAGEGGEGVRQGLPPLGEHRPDHRLELPLVADRHRRGPEREPDDRRVDFGRRPEGAGRQRQQAANVGMQLHGDRQHAVVASPGYGLQPVGHLALDHQRGIEDRGFAGSRAAAQPGCVGADFRLRRNFACAESRARDQPEQDRRRDVVGQVPGDAERSLGLRDAGRPPGRRRPRGRRCRGACGRSSAAMSRSTSIAVRCATRGASRNVRAPGPGPISTKRSVGCGAIAATTLSAHAPSRKCWPKRFRVRIVQASSIGSPRQYFSSISSISSSLMPK